MKAKLFEQLMRKGEYLSSLRVPYVDENLECGSRYSIFIQKTILQYVEGV